MNFVSETGAVFCISMVPITVKFKTLDDFIEIYLHTNCLFFFKKKYQFHARKHLQDRYM